MVDGRHAQRNRDAAVEQSGLARRCTELGKVEIDARNRAAQLRDEPRQHRIRQDEHVADREPPALAGGDRARGFGAVDGQRQSFARTRQQRLAGLGQVHAAGAAAEQRRADLGLELADLDGQRRLSHP
ncbi:hypothetical protein ABIF94_000247 [Bradyrhizobium ottawaense]